MRRRWIVALAAGGAVLLAAVVLLVPPAAEFDFLAGERPVSVSVTEWRGAPADMRTRFVVYSMKAHYLKLFEQAKEELTARGYEWQRMGGSSSATFLRNPARPDDVQQAEAIMLFGDTKFKEDDAPMAIGNDEGWVTVKIIGGAKPSWMDQFRRWIGV